MTSRDTKLLMGIAAACFTGIHPGDLSTAVNVVETVTQAAPYPDDLRYNPHEYRVTPVPPKGMEESR